GGFPASCRSCRDFYITHLQKITLIAWLKRHRERKPFRPCGCLGCRKEVLPMPLRLGQGLCLDISSTRTRDRLPWNPTGKTFSRHPTLNTRLTRSAFSSSVRIQKRKRKSWPS